MWCEVLGWLQQQPDATAAELMDRLILRYPERYSRGQLRTLQRRVRQWRSVMAKQLLYASAENSEIYEERPVDIGPVLLPHRRMLPNSSRFLIDAHRPDVNRSLLTIGPTAFG